MPTPYFTPGLFTFLRQLTRHNNREWFEAHRDRYVADVEAPALRFIADFGARLGTLSKAFVADPKRSGGSMFRIYRDTRFSADKTPYKTWIGMRFPHHTSRKGENVPAFYLHLSPGDSFGGGGLYHAETLTVTRVRQHIVGEPRAWAKVLKTGAAIQGDSLKRVPPGYDAAHKYAEDLKRKDFYVLQALSDRDITSPRFLDRFTDVCRDTAPLIEFLTRSLGLRW